MVNFTILSFAYYIFIVDDILLAFENSILGGNANARKQVQSYF